MNLIICYTPFQVLIAEKIIDKYPEQEFYGLMIQEGSTYNSNNKYESYYNRLSKKCNNSKHIILNTRTKLYTLYSFFHIKLLSLRFSRFEKIFFANLQSESIFVLLSNLEFIEMNTFDDGIGSLKDNIRYNTLPKTSFLKKLIFKFLGVKLNTISIISNIKKHFTIYSEMKNFADKLEYLELGVNNINNVNGLFVDSISIFLGQPLYESIDSNSDTLNIELTKKIIEHYKIEYYFPHPRENYVIPDIQYIRTDLIFEDYICNYIYRNPNIEINIYNFLSGAAINVSNLKNVRITCVKPDNLNEFWNDMYSLFENNPLVNIIPWSKK